MSLEAKGGKGQKGGRSLFKALFTISGFTFLSRIMGLARDIIFASIFGAGAAMDAFSVAFRIPNLFRRFFGEGAFNQAFVPLFTEYHTHRTRMELKALLANVSGTLGFVLLSITMLGLLFPSHLVLLFASGFKADPYKFALATDLVQLMVPYIFFICMTALYSGALNALERFAIPAFAPILLNIFLIVAAFFSPYFDEPIMALGYGVLFAGMAQLLLLFFALQRLRLITSPRIHFKESGVKQVMLLMLPALIGSSSSQINILINTQLASRLVEGSVTWLYYSDRLVEFALGTFAVALGTIVLPRLSRFYAEGDRENLAHTVNWGLNLSLIIGIPAMIGLYILAEPLLALLFMRGEFGVADVSMSAKSLATYALSIPAFFIIRVFAPLYFARKDTKTPVKFSLIAIGTNIVLQFMLVRYLQHAGLALSSSIAAWVNALLLIWGVTRSGMHSFSGFWNWQKLALFNANIALIAYLLLIASFNTFWMEALFLWRLMATVAVLVSAILLYFSLLQMSGLSLRTLLAPKEH